MATREFTPDELEALGIPYEWDAEHPAERLSEEQIDTRRWVSVHEVVFRAPDDGKAWAVCYVRGLTESQDDTDPWEYEGSVITATEMEPHEVTVTEWRVVE
ncbi:hypothetical protein OG709_30050 [Streptomyces sp. NBC_01267]|uniref:hypothetical protein n=1 Tax=Streptomyces sp. NBC_01267 TaxID=2903805 RepID=UPI002E302B07|nr:hypothetical protein [Streptomyces sp. NBC_01267]